MRTPDLNELLEAKEGEHVEFKEAKNRFDFVVPIGTTRAGKWFPAPETVKDCVAPSNKTQSRHNSERDNNA